MADSSQYDPEHAAAFLYNLFGSAPGDVQLVAIGPGGTDWRTGTLDQLVAWAGIRDRAPLGVYFRVTTLQPGRTGHGRGGAEDTMALVCLWADLDYGTAGHKPPPGGLPLPADAPAARALVDNLPTPTILVHSGGGLYPLWKLATPFLASDADALERAAKLAAGWQQAIGRAATARGVAYGTGVGDLARVLRLPGTRNWKTGEPRGCTVMYDTGPTYTIDELETALAATLPPEPAAPAARPAPAPIQAYDYTLGAGAGPDVFDVLDETADWLDVLPAGWTQVRSPDRDCVAAFRRPGATSTVSAKVLRQNPHVLVVHSEDAGMPSGAGQRLTKGRVYAWTHHGGDESAAARGILDGTSPGCASLPAATSTALDRYFHTAAMPALVLGQPRTAEATPRPMSLWLPDMSWSCEPDPTMTGATSTESVTVAPVTPAPVRDVASVFDLLVRQEAEKLRIREAARDMVAKEKAAPLLAARTAFDLGTLTDMLARPAPPADRIAGMMPWNASALIVAQRKAGKTTLVLNLAYSLLTGAPFLGRFDVTPIQGRIAFLNFEVSGHTLTRWAADARIPADRLVLVNLRGHANPFHWEDTTASLAGQLRDMDVESLIVDPFGRAFPGMSQNDAGEVQPFLMGLDDFTRAQVGARDLFLTAHSGWLQGRTRGSSALEDWADAIWTMTREKMDEHDSNDDDSDEFDVEKDRYLKAEGRDVDIPESRLKYDEETRMLTLVGGNKKQHSTEKRLGGLAEHVMTYVVGHPGESGNAIEKALRESGAARFRKGEVAKAVQSEASAGRITAAPGPRGATLYYPTGEATRWATDDVDG